MNRYNAFTEAVYFFLYRLYLGFSFCTVGFIETNLLLRYWQIFVWGRVKEINEDLAIKVIVRSMLFVSAGLTFVMNLNPPITTFFMTFSSLESKDIPVPPRYCCPDFFDPLNQRYKMLICFMHSVSIRVDQKIL